MTYHFWNCSETKYDYDLQRSERLPQLVTTYPEMLVIHNMKKAHTALHRTALTSLALESVIKHVDLSPLEFFRTPPTLYIAANFEYITIIYIPYNAHSA